MSRRDRGVILLARGRRWPRVTAFRAAAPHFHGRVRGAGHVGFRNLNTHGACCAKTRFSSHFRRVNCGSQRRAQPGKIDITLAALGNTLGALIFRDKGFL